MNFFREKENLLIVSNKTGHINYRIQQSNKRIEFDKHFQFQINKNWEFMIRSYQKQGRPIWNGDVYNLYSLSFDLIKKELLFNLGITDYKNTCFVTSQSYNDIISETTIKPMGVQIIVETSDENLVFGKRNFEDNLVALVCGLITPKETMNSNDVFIEQAKYELFEELGLINNTIDKLELVGVIKNKKQSVDVIVYCKLKINFNDVNFYYNQYGNNENSMILCCLKRENEILEFINKQELNNQSYSILSWIISKEITII